MNNLTPLPLIGYHLKHINPGKIGYPSKIIEEFEEFKDALVQNCSIMALIELSDLIGAIFLFLKNKQMLLEIDNIKNEMNKYTSFSQCDFETLNTFFNIYISNIEKNDIENHLIYEETIFILKKINDFILEFNLKFSDLDKMSSITQRVFLNGFRQNKS